MNDDLALAADVWSAPLGSQCAAIFTNGSVVGELVDGKIGPATRLVRVGGGAVLVGYDADGVYRAALHLRALEPLHMVQSGSADADWRDGMAGR